MEFGGIVVSEGNAEGILYYQSSDCDIQKYSLRTYDEEIERFLTARDQVANFLEELSAKTTAEYGITAGAIVCGYRMLVMDAGFAREVATWVKQEKFTAEYAVSFVTERIASQMSKEEQEEQPSRGEDVVSVGKILIRNLVKEEGSPKKEKTPVILLKDDIDICEILTQSQQVKGILLLRGKEDAHVNVLAKTRELPMVINVSRDLLLHVGDQVSIKEGKVLLLD